MKLIFLGTCSGTEPMPNAHHVSFVLNSGHRLYWFDCGETCSYAAHNLGLDLLETRAIFITHSHMDHIGGLPNLLWTLQKLIRRRGSINPLSGKEIDVLIPNMESWNAIMRLLRQTEDGFKIDFRLNARCYDEGIALENDDLRVTAIRSFHMGEPANGEPWPAFSFIIEADGKRIIYSGDVRAIDDLQPVLRGADILLMETGHHQVDKICQYLKSNDLIPKTLLFIHHGRAILKDRDAELATAISIIGNRVRIINDGDELEI